MYVVLINDDNTLSAPKKQRIVQKSKLVDTLYFLVNPIYNGHDMTDATLLLEYVLPCSRKYCDEILVLNDERYEEYLKYTLPVDTNLTNEAGKIELQLTFLYVDIDENGNSVQRVRKTAPPITITVVPIAAWSDIIPDAALSALDQRILKQDAQIKALNNLADMLNDNKADNLKYDKENNELQLLAGNKEIGNKVTLKICDYNLEEGVPIVEFGDASSGEDTPDVPQTDECDVVEF